MQRPATSDQRPTTLEAKRQQVERILRAFDRVIVAFSGGVDSTLLAKLARDVLGRQQVLAVTADSPSLARHDLTAAREIAQQLDVEHLVIPTHEVEHGAYRRNTDARCYVCKQVLFVELEVVAKAQGIRVILYGAIGDDQLAQRSGQRAAREHAVRAPLQEVGLTKLDVRALAKALGVPNWDRPSNACLSSRIPHGLEVTEAKLRQIERAEQFLVDQGFRLVRVRHQGAHARIEVGTDELDRLRNPVLCAAIVRQFATLGFETVGIDRAGYHEGGADRLAADEVPL